ncbi:aminomethyl-transferring glycine dehydrogenase subunit GcvPA [Priestia flexa]|jgi:glycine dehydrogenase subunit 1|uniref:Probable glycine dehydrogenase (decarboxylating) subunit 1 n=1 Tax=Priestia flexa TaxID=86664 RepID=A0A1N6N4K6_9BACI|nr:aminomethyl-transferring glycine dehydrogenase subunit GcvPA [Priestia flexa]AQX53770.1 glycine dehydrogenase (aminomethyl-transferring) [Priestia flexa]MBN8250384.1 aminomethyl-transferring glycine dehydrogenase subunit GcvPA [Priestia flexa]MBN8432794.1 aminomethyl-transferring glycine dehydrogenase subunit GcvPA [Priestia flexa]MBY6085099.1 aminomethyl-transferring glycine dehydrogenase subunit GcvPA [Priestia flexa]MCA0965220.1 aminomethyl-transferring glycine dehydrogenase subunit GcvP
MVHRYLPMTSEDQQQMLKAIGVSSVDELFSDIPESVRFQGEYNIKKAASESELVKELTNLATKNKNVKEYASFLGAGVYDHYMPIIVDHVISRSEFYTAYTPYQPEISQGELQAIFEFQTMICELTGMDVANSSMYDGGTALAEAAMLSAGQTRKKKVLVSETVHPESRAVLETYAAGQYIEVVEVPSKDGVTDLTVLKERMDDDVAAVIVQYPNFFGQVEPLREIEAIAHQGKGMFVVSSNPLSLGLLTPPGQFGADIVVGDAQPFGIPTQFGGPHCGYFATTTKLMRKIPGRLVGQTIDENGKRGFVLTLQAREQHIRRDKATSNICSNQALNALAASVAMTALGKQGVKEMATQNLSKTHYAYNALKASEVDVVFNGSFFNELVVKLPQPSKEVNQKLLAKHIIGGYDLGRDYHELKDHMLLAFTELRTKEEIDQLVKELGDLYA